MKSTIIAPVGCEKADPIFAGIREFPTEKVVLIAHKSKMDRAKKAKSDLERFKIPASIVEIDGDLWESTFQAIAEIKGSSSKNVMVNIGCGDSVTRCAATSAAFVNGLKTFDVMGNEIMMLPVLKFSYYKLIPEKKMNILRLLNDQPDCCTSLEDMSRRLKMSLPLLSYHVNGNPRSEGLRQMGLVETTQRSKRIQIRLTTLGKLLIKGYVK